MPFISRSDSAIWPHEEVCFPVALCPHWREVPGSRGGRWMLPGRSRDVDGVPAVVIRHGLLAGALGVLDGHLVVPWVPGRRRRPIMGWWLGC
jgi:hypothetical protein